MSEYYHNDLQRAQSSGRSRSLGGVLLDGILSVLSVLAWAAMALTLAAPHIRPVGWFFPILSLIAPATYLVTVLLALYWIIRWRWGWASAMLVPVVVGLFHLSLFLKVDFRREYDREVSRRGTLTAMTYNVRFFYGPDKKNSVDSILTLIRTTDPDILCLQEFYPRVEGRTKEAFDRLMEGYHSTLGIPSSQSLPVDKMQQVIYSKLPIVRSGSVVAGDSLSAIGTVWADVVTGEDTLRVFNNHLRSTQITAADDDFITRHRYLSDTARDDKIRSIVRRFRDSSIARASQADSVAAAIDVSPYRQVVCGDFNDTPMSYTYHVIADGLQDAFRECGKGFSHTYRGFNNTLRIDFVLLSPGLVPVGYEVLPVDYSDHYPVVARFKIEEN